MKAPTKKYKGYTWVGWINLIFFQWFFLRLAYTEDKENPDYKIQWLFMIGIIPTTGWTKEKPFRTFGK